ncbi:MAG: putative toxin-antitoxin system toxin component, PIN family [Chloroflexota bacterium]
MKRQFHRFVRSTIVCTRSIPSPRYYAQYGRLSTGGLLVRVVVDTNVVVAACFAPASAAARVLRRWRAGRFELVTSPALLRELAVLVDRLQDVPAVRRAQQCLVALHQEFRHRAHTVQPAPLDLRLRDPADEPVLGTAVAGGAAYLVSTDAVLLGADGYRGVRVLTPSRFLALLEHHPGEPC